MLAIVVDIANKVVTARDTRAGAYIKSMISTTPKLWAKRWVQVSVSGRDQRTNLLRGVGARDAYASKYCDILPS